MGARIVREIRVELYDEPRLARQLVAQYGALGVKSAVSRLQSEYSGARALSIRRRAKRGIDGVHARAQSEQPFDFTPTEKKRQEGLIPLLNSRSSSLSLRL